MANMTKMRDTSIQLSWESVGCAGVFTKWEFVSCDDIGYVFTSSPTISLLLVGQLYIEEGYYQCYSRCHSTLWCNAHPLNTPPSFISIIHKRLLYPAFFHPVIYLIYLFSHFYSPSHLLSLLRLLLQYSVKGRAKLCVSSSLQLSVMVNGMIDS